MYVFASETPPMLVQPSDIGRPSLLYFRLQRHWQILD